MQNIYPVPYRLQSTQELRVNAEAQGNDLALAILDQWEETVEDARAAGYDTGYENGYRDGRAEAEEDE